MAFEDENINEYSSHLEALSEGNFQIVEGEPDITGWDVLDTEGNRFGEVDDLLFDIETRKVRYLVVELEADEVDIAEDRLVLIPIGVADLYEEDDEVIVPHVTAAQLATLPIYEPGKLTPAAETQIRSTFDNLPMVIYQKDSFYQHDHFDEQKFYDRTPRNTVDSTIDTELEDPNYTTNTDVSDRLNDGFSDDEDNKDSRNRF
jgi:sporulation protein YlmC with PRC-barrel domain